MVLSVWFRRTSCRKVDTGWVVEQGVKDTAATENGLWGDPGGRQTPRPVTMCRAAGQEGRALSPQRGHGAAGLGEVSLRRSQNMAPRQPAVSLEGRLSR